MTNLNHGHPTLSKLQKQAGNVAAKRCGITRIFFMKMRKGKPGLDHIANGWNDRQNGMTTADTKRQNHDIETGKILL